MSDEGFVLFAQPSFFAGASRLVDFFGVLNTYNKSHTPEEADFRAILSDWEAVGLSLLLAERKFSKEYEAILNYEPSSKIEAPCP